MTNRHGRRGLTIRITALAALLAATAAVPARAATLGQLTPLNCFSTTAITGCESQPGLNAAGGLTDSVAVSPDGQSLYAIMSASTLVQFAVQADGSLAYVTCIGDATLGGANPCPVQAAGIKEGNGGGGSVVVSPDGASLYVSGYDSNSVAAFRRDTSGPSLGHLTSDGCLANTAVTTCDAVAGSTHGQAAGLDGPEKIALSPDGANLYVPAISSHTITVFKRQTSGVTVGKLTPDGCLAYTGTTTCDAVGGSTHGQAPGVEVPDSVAISADGGSVYVTDALEAVAVFIRDTSGPTPGRLTSDGCLASAGTTKCDAAGGSTHGQVPGLTNPHDVVVSSDGAHVYVGGQGTLTALKRDASGATPSRLVSDGCLAVTGLSSCDGVSGSTSGRAQAATSSGLALSPDGKDLYTSDYGSSRIGVFAVTAAGGLTFDGCIADTGTTSCDGVSGSTQGQTPGIHRPSGLAVAPSGKSFYATNDSPGSIAAFARYVPPPPGPEPSPPAPTPTDTTPAVTPSPPPLSAPAPTLRLVSVKVSKTIALTVKALINAAGSVSAQASFKAPVVGKSATATRRLRTVKLGSASVVRTSGGAVRLVIKPSRAALAILRSGKRFAVKVKVTFRPRVGAAIVRTRTVAVKLAKHRG